MTEKQIERVKTKITKIKKALAADKRKWGGFYNDGRGLRYLPPELYLKIEDYTGSLRYFNWFKKNFEDDSASSIFMFEWALTLFKTKRFSMAENKVKEVFALNLFLLDHFLEKKMIPFEEKEGLNWGNIETIKYLNYTRDKENLIEFAEWLELYMKSESFVEFANEIIEIQDSLINLPGGKRRSELFERRGQLLQEL
ncbi:MAG: hypothetical protein ACPGSD_15670 [Flavobacteriales bacterium]